PHFGPPVKFSFKLPFLREVYFAWKIPFPKKHTFNGQHHWEIGKRGYSVKKVRKVISKHFVVEKEFIPFENQYHRFYVLKRYEN
ncbi:methyltransferase type 11, partial [Candidatus Kaiserbacteria bacterium CG10_big_fil_rev_8_21_14_0_10_45_20]